MAVDYFLKFSTIPGESQDSKHKGEIEIESWSWGGEQAGTFAHGSGGGAGKVSIRDFIFTKRIDKASPKLFLAMANGEHIPEAVLVARKAGKEQQEYFKVTLKDVIVSSHTTSSSGGSSDSDVPRESVSLNYSKIEVEYKEQKPDGTLSGVVKAGWDIAQNKAA